MCTDPSNMGLYIIILQHEAMAVDGGQVDGPEDLIAISLQIQTTVDKMSLCSLSVTHIN